MQVGLDDLESPGDECDDCMKRATVTEWLLCVVRQKRGSDGEVSRAVLFQKHCEKKHFLLEAVPYRPKPRFPSTREAVVSRPPENRGVASKVDTLTFHDRRHGHLTKICVTNGHLRT